MVGERGAGKRLKRIKPGPGEMINMKDIMKLAKQRADRFGVRTVVVATNTGASAERALKVFGEGYRIIASGNPASAHERGLVHHKGISGETKTRLQNKGIQVALADQSFVQKYFDHSRESRCMLSELKKRMQSQNPFPLEAVLCNVLDLFCDSVRVCIEICCLASDAGVLTVDRDCIAIATPGPESNCPHAAVILRPDRTEDMFRGNLRVKDILLVPADNDHWFSNRPLWQA